MTIEKFKLHGFKSFAEPTEVVIGKGMTGIVGPNGCGKSNLIEALRWGVGETSSKSMRAENGMEDLIFAGTQPVNGKPGRPPRNSAEVVITMDNSARHAPAEFNNADTLEIARRMERGDGSAYRINGRPALARDVQVLFKDAGFGAKSSAIVSQGKVAAIINAKPSERRAILDEAAGTAGLATRRHEADLRLRGTEQNLERAEALEKGLSDQLGSLRKQARQAARRREIDDLIRRAEATAFLVRWRIAAARIAAAQAAHENNESLIKERILELNASTARLLELEALSAPLISTRSDAETALALARVAVDGIRKEATAARNALAAAQKNAARTDADIERERNVLAESDGELEDLKDQLAMAEDDRQYDTTLIEEASAETEEAREVLTAAAEDLEKASTNHVRGLAERKALEDRVSRDREFERSLRAKTETLSSRLTTLQNDLASLPGQPDDLTSLVREADELETALAAIDAELTELRVAEAVARSTAEASAQALALAVKEQEGLQASTRKETLSARVTTDPGFEQALAVVLGEGINAEIGGVSSHRWERSTLRASTPAGTSPLSRHVKVPSELEAAISGIGVANEDALDNAEFELSPGQAIVTASGRIRRWDGLRSSSDAAWAEAIRRAGRIRELECLLVKLRDEVSATSDALDHAVALNQARVATEKDLRNRLRDVRTKLDEARKTHETALRRHAEIEAQLAATREGLETAYQDTEEAAARLAESEDLLQSLPPQHLSDGALAVARNAHSVASKSFEAARNKLDKTRREADARQVLIQNIRQKMAEFDKRVSSSRSLIADFIGRASEIRTEISLLEEAVSTAPEREAEAAEALEEAIIAHEASVDRARETDQYLADVRVQTRTCEAQLAERREERARILAEIKAYTDAASELSREIAERLGCQPDALPATAGVTPDAELPDLDACEARVQRLLREREGLGIVNLLADEQLREVETKLGDASKVRDELREAVRRLRDSIAKFDRERRERLTEAFSSLDGNFQELFSRLFHGGQAYLKLSGSDDILEAGMEIYAAPPGKKMQSMSLLSGGEQALTALAMIFAAFLIRPAPVCVLDEVDAALDDANVDRMCSLVMEMAKDTTRFLVITHRALTMARCDRLYGVTMAERGVSRLTSLDMEQAVKFVESFEPPTAKD